MTFKARAFLMLVGGRAELRCCYTQLADLICDQPVKLVLFSDLDINCTP